MRFDIRYTTLFSYDDVVRESHNEIRACPASTGRQQVISYRVSTHPSARVKAFTDYWGTRVDAFGIREPHVALEVVAEATVETAAQPLVVASARTGALDGGFRDAHLEYLATTRHTVAGPKVREIADRVRAVAGDDVVDTVLAIHRQVNRHLLYAPGSTHIGVNVEDVLERGEGVCQDYAHTAIAVCRLMGIPARYVSGYFFATDESTGEEVEGDVVAVQTHAWFEAAVPGHGWLALDPTNALQVGSRHIAIGFGREYDDVTPIRGVYRGVGVASVEAHVEIRRQAAQQQHQQQQQ